MAESGSDKQKISKSALYICRVPQQRKEEEEEDRHLFTTLRKELGLQAGGAFSFMLMRGCLTAL